MGQKGADSGYCSEHRKVVVVGYLRQRFDMEDNWKPSIPDAVIQFALVSIGVFTLEKSVVNQFTKLS